MPLFLRQHAWRLSLALIFGVVLTAAFLVLRNSPSEAFPGMPSDQRSYWEWVSSINQDPSMALESGIALLGRHPHLKSLYSRLAEVCAEQEKADECRAAIEATAPADGLAALYRRAALAQLLGEDELEEEEAAWKEIASSDLLDPSMARIVVDRARRDRESALLEEIEAEWDRALAADSSLAGAAFGLGYAAVMFNEWDRATPLLEHVTRVMPADANAYGELGRVHFFTGGYEPFVEVMQAAIDRARRTYDVEAELRFRGNLGMGYMQFKGDLENAGAMFEAALTQAIALSQGREQAFNYNRLANVRGRQHRYDEALVLLDSAETQYARHLVDKRYQVLTAKGLIFKNTFRFTEAETVLENALANAREHSNVSGIAGALIGLVQVRYNMGRYGAAHDAALEALEITSRDNINDFAIAARLVLGEIERLRGNHQAAEDHFTKGLEMATVTGNRAREMEMRRQLGISALQIGDLGAANEHFRTLLSASEDQGSDVQKADAWFWIGSTYSLYKNYDGAIEAFDHAMDVLGDTDEQLLGTIQRNKASALYYMNRMDESLALFKEASGRIEDGSLQQWSADVAIGHVLIRKGRYAEALKHFDQAEAIEDELQWSAAHWYLLYGRAMSYWGQREYARADAAFRDAISVIETLRDNVRDPEDRSLFVYDKIEVYDSFASFLESRGNTDEAFHFNERARSRTLVDLLYTTRQGGQLDLSQAADRAIDLNRQVQSVERELSEEALLATGSGADLYRENRAAYLRRERIRSDSLYRSLQIDLFGMKRLYTFDPVVADSVYGMLSADEAILVYDLRHDQLFEDSPGSVVYVITKTGVESKVLDVDVSELTETIRFFRDAIEQSVRGGGGNWRTAASKLYAGLVAPVLPILPKGVTHLNVVPDGPLHYLPFAALLDERDRFLVQTYSISATPSVSILKLSRERNPMRWRSMLLLADPDSRLPGARREVLSIVQDSPSRRHVLLGKEASQAMFESMAANYDVLHFATHGNFNSRQPWDSHLELHDGALSVDEIGRLSLDAYLVTLSACETALASGLVSDIPDGDEWVGLNQAFLAAGTPTVMASLWPIDDRVSSSLMVNFYKVLGPDGKARALADVQRDFIRRTETRHPFYWAAFAVIGDPL